MNHLSWFITFLPCAQFEIEFVHAGLNTDLMVFIEGCGIGAPVVKLSRAGVGMVRPLADLGKQAITR
jgi:hypothetical protein